MFVEFEEAQSWYTVALDGLRHLETALHTNKRTRISQATLDQIRGMTPDEWREFLEDRESEHEMFACLALLASFEGSIRRDAEWRGETGSGPYHQRFRTIAQEKHVSIAKIFEVWESILTPGHPLRKQLTILRNLYRDRNVIAHGKASRGQFAFELIFTKLQEALRKWREFAPNFNR
jgi:hypothetical protein